MFSKLIHNILDFLFPERCVRCGEKGTSFCPQCLNDSDIPEMMDKDGIFAASNYADKFIREAIWSFKYRGVRGLSRPLAELLYERLFKDKIAEVMGSKKTLIVPVPLSKKRLKERGFNQSEELAKHFWGLIIANNPAYEGKLLLETKALVKNRHTESQVSLEDRSARLRNLNSSMGVGGESVMGKNIILVDDVSTTGATMKEARRALKLAGAKRVIAVVVAR